jgi:RNA polymerase sigma-70 factor (ECF subfamily)
MVSVLVTTDGGACVAPQELSGFIPALRARARRFCGDETESEDLVQETLLRAMEVEQTFGSLSHLKAWLFTVLKNLFVSRRRREATRRRALGELRGALESSASASASGPPFLTRSLERALDAVPGPFSSVIKLVDLQDHAYEEAAQALGIPVGTVMSRLSRGRRKLASALAGGGDPSP